MTTASADPIGGAVSSLVVTAPRPAHRSAFHELLSELNPLQYLPVVGSIYRAVTGDRIPEEARTVGSLVMSGLTGGPAGVAISAAMMAVEKVIGVDPERLGQSVLAEVGIGGSGSGGSAVPGVKAAAALSAPAPSVDAAPVRATYWSPAQLAAYGVTTTAGGALRRGSVEGADVLNDLELANVAPKMTSAAPQQA